MLGIVFAGQGSQIVGMGMDFYHHYSEAKDVFDEADSALGWSVSEFCNETDATRLAHTRKVQAAILTMEIAFYVHCNHVATFRLLSQLDIVWENIVPS
ncbi:acyltransferase domain-containing protein [Acinetobacter baumannii]|nr:acyltransferase domain-containing protein [Acinetobacter baumannii]